MPWESPAGGERLALQTVFQRGRSDETHPFTDFENRKRVNVSGGEDRLSTLPLLLPLDADRQGDKL